MSLHPRQTSLLQVSLVLILAAALAGCFGGEDPPPVEQRLLTDERASGLGLYHCVLDEEMQQQTGIMSNPGQVPPQLFAGDDAGDQIEEFWLQLLGPEPEMPCDEVADDALIIVSAMAFRSESDLEESMGEENMCAQVTGTLLVGDIHAVATEGNAPEMDAVGDALTDQNSDLSDPCA